MKTDSGLALMLEATEHTCNVPLQLEQRYNENTYIGLSTAHRHRSCLPRQHVDVASCFRMYDIAGNIRYLPMEGKINKSSFMHKLYQPNGKLHINTVVGLLMTPRT